MDSNNNVWFGTEGTASTSQDIGEVAAGTTTATYPSNSAYNSATATAGTYTLFVDAANGNKMIYAGSQSAGVVYEYLTTAAPTATTSLGSSATNGVAVDKDGNLWVVYTGSGANGGSLSRYVPGSTTATSTCKITTSGATGMYNPRGLAIDGNNRMFVSSYTAVTGTTIPGPASSSLIRRSARLAMQRATPAPSSRRLLGTQSTRPHRRVGMRSRSARLAMKPSTARVRFGPSTQFRAQSRAFRCSASQLQSTRSSQPASMV